MRKRLLDAFRLLLPLGPSRRRDLAALAAYLSEQELSDVRYLAKLRRIGFHPRRLETSEEFFPDKGWPELSLAVEDEETGAFVRRINAKVTDAALLETFDELKKDALDRLQKLVAPNIVGLDAAKRAAALQLFAAEPVHILLVGDPGTGKTEILRSIKRLAPHAVFGLGSGASKAGLTGVYDGKEFHPGLLVLADEGIALVDELNLLKKEDAAGLYSAMEKGFITYDKKGKHERFDARVRVLSTANPKGGRFVGKDVRFLKSQLPFEEALLSRFHLFFLVRKPSDRELEEITRRIVKQDIRELPDGDTRLVQAYVRYAEKLVVTFDPKYESMVVNFVDDLKRAEKELVAEVSPRLVIGVIRLAKAFARARLSRHTGAEDVEAAMRLMKDALAGKA